MKKLKLKSKPLSKQSKEDLANVKPRSTESLGLSPSSSSATLVSSNEEKTTITKSGPPPTFSQIASEAGNSGTVKRGPGRPRKVDVDRIPDQAPGDAQTGSVPLSTPLIGAPCTGEIATALAAMPGEMLAQAFQDPSLALTPAQISGLKPVAIPFEQKYLQNVDPLWAFVGAVVIMYVPALMKVFTYSQPVKMPSQATPKDLEKAV